jgi:hypothetical protein
MTTVEVLTARKRVWSPVVGMGHSAEDQLDLIHEIRSAERKVQTCAGIEDDEATIWVPRALVLVGHSMRSYALPQTCPNAPGIRSPRSQVGALMDALTEPKQEARLNLFKLSAG